MNDRVDTLPNSCVDEKGRAVFKEIRPRLALLRHSAVHRLHLEHSAFLEQIHAALMLTEILRDDSSKSKLQAVYTRLEETILETERSTEAVQQDVSHKLLALQEQRHELDRREQQLRASAAKQFVRISKEADRFLLGCVDNLLDANKLENESGKDIQRESSEICVDENDIESDEDQLQVDLK
jgi:DNA anti-recombination protein RmuC